MPQTTNFLVSEIIVNTRTILKIHVGTLDNMIPNTEYRIQFFFKFYFPNSDLVRLNHTFLTPFLFNTLIYADLSYCTSLTVFYSTRITIQTIFEIVLEDYSDELNLASNHMLAPC